MKRVYFYDHLTRRTHESVLALEGFGITALHDLVTRAFCEHFSFVPVDLVMWEPDHRTAEGYVSGMKVLVEPFVVGAVDTGCGECRRAA